MSTSILRCLAIRPSFRPYGSAAATGTREGIERTGRGVDGGASGRRDERRYTPGVLRSYLHWLVGLTVLFVLLEPLFQLLRACWQTFDEAVSAAAGRELRKGPRGGGRDVEAIIQHVLGAEAAYLVKIGWKFRQAEGGDPKAELQRTRQMTLEALTAAARGEVPAQGPRGGTLWTPRYFVRRVAWDVLDHASEIEDRIR